MKTNFLIIPILSLLSGIPAFAQTDTTALDRKDCYITDVREKLIGQTPGVIAVSSVGTPGMTPSVYVHGFHPYAEKQAFYVDGVRVKDLNFLAPESIESIEVVAGGDAVLRFGPDASCGAIVVTTRNAAQKGFHASYSFAGALHQLAWEPQQISLQEWQAYNPSLKDYIQSPDLEDPFVTSFAQTHHLSLQSKTDKLSVTADLDFLDNDGPLRGRMDSHRRYSGTGRISYRPLKWLDVDLSVATGKSDINSQEALIYLLYNQPVPSEFDRAERRDLSFQQHHNTAFSVQGKVEFRPVDGLYIRAFYGINQDKDQEETYDWSWKQYGLDLGYARTFGKHSAGLDASVKQQDFVTGRQASAMYYAHTNGCLTDLNLRLHYDWNKRLFADFGLYKRNGKNLSDAPKKPALAANLRWMAGENWSVFGSWSRSFNFLDLSSSIFRNDLLGTHLREAAFSRLNAGAEGGFQTGRNTVHARVNGFLDHDDYYIYFIPGDDDRLSLRNFGLELSASWRYAVDDFAFGVDPSLTLYGNRVTKMFDNIVSYVYCNRLSVREGSPFGTAWLYPVNGVDPESGAPILGDEKQRYGNGVFPTASLGLHGFVSWKNWQLSILGHGNFGQSIQHTYVDGLSRYCMSDRKYEYFMSSESYRNSSDVLFNTSFFRIDQIRLDYSLPLKAVGIDLFASLENFILFTKFPGSDPEYSLIWDYAGLDIPYCPSSRRIVFGAKFSL